MSAILSAFGVEGIVTRPAPNDAPIPTSVVWVPPTPESVPQGTEFQWREGLRILAIPVASVPSVPGGTLIECPADGGGVTRTWQVEAVLVVDAEHVRVVVIEV